MKTKLTYLILMVAAISFNACKKDETPKLIPTVTTGAASAVTVNSLTMAGSVTSNGNANITVVGFVYSANVAQPTLADNKKELTSAGNDFSAVLDGLTSGTIYHVRAYATNSVGTGYGSVVDVSTTNLPPVASEVTISGSAGTGKTLTGSYSYSDPESDAQSGSTFKWYIANDAQGAGEAAIAGATALTYVIQNGDIGKYIRFGVTPKAGAGTATGTEVKSSYVGPVVEGNLAPVASNVAITGSALSGTALTATYTYSDAESDAESGTGFQWYSASDGSGTGEASINGATASTYTIQAGDIGKFIRVGVTPKAATGKTPGLEVKSSFVGAVAEAVTFTYNGASVTYGVITSAATGKKWLDRNLGSSRAAQAVDDYQAFGDMFQWGRLADGHQLVTRTGMGDVDATGVTGATSAISPFETSATDVPTTNKFIINADAATKLDWRATQNDNLWQGVSGVNNPCPTGWRIPTQAEWAAETLTTGPDAFTKLKLTYNGQRDVSTSNFHLTGTTGAYWTSTIRPSTTTPGYTRMLQIDATTANVTNTSYTNRGMGQACRCIKD